MNCVSAQIKIKSHIFIFDVFITLYIFFFFAKTTIQMKIWNYSNGSILLLHKVAPCCILHHQMMGGGLGLPLAPDNKSGKTNARQCDNQGLSPISTPPLPTLVMLNSIQMHGNQLRSVVRLLATNRDWTFF